MKFNKYYLLYFIDMSIVNYKRKMIRPLQELEVIFGYKVIYQNRIQDRYWYYLKLYSQILKWK